VNGKSLMVLKGEIQTPPLSEAARRETGFLLRRLQQGENLGLPHSRPMPVIGLRCHELRVNDADKRGGSFTGLMKTRSWWWKCSRKRHARRPAAS
jgi:hypothetical protein